MSSSSSTSNGAIVAATLAGAAFMYLRRAQSGGGAPSEDYEGLSSEDVSYLRRLMALKRTIVPPAQSDFRVCAMLKMEDSRSGATVDVSGTNWETVSLSNSLCAERSACSKLREMAPMRLRCVYITTDLHECVTPGLLCREVLLELEDACDSTPVVLGGDDGDGRLGVVRRTTLGALYPHPSVLRGVERRDLASAALALAAEAENVAAHYDVSGASSLGILERVQRAELHKAAVEATTRDARDDLHPIRYGAAALLDDGTIVSAAQFKALEYGNSVGAVVMLLGEIERRRRASGALPVVLMQADQHGTLHAPFAQGRTCLFEMGFGACAVVLHAKAPAGTPKKPGVKSCGLRLAEVTVATLVVDVPDIAGHLD